MVNRKSNYLQKSAPSRFVLLPTGYVERRDDHLPIPISEEDKENFGDDIEKVLTERNLPYSHADFGFAPDVRNIDEMYDEDLKHAEAYANIINEDDEVEVEGLGDQVLNCVESWKEAFDGKLLENIIRSKYIRPRNIQCSVIPLILDHYDLIVSAETGVGKTAAYLLPIIDECMKDKIKGEFTSAPNTPYAVILGPTRELVKQAFEQATKFAHDTGVSVAKAYGEYSVKKNKKEIGKLCDIICATPGRFLDFVENKVINLSKVRFLVFDECDILLAGDFKRVIDTALFGCEIQIAINRTTLFFSATMNDETIQLAKEYMRPEEILIVKNKVIAPSKKCVQEFKIAPKVGKFGQLLAYFRSELVKVDKDAKRLSPTFIFCEQRLSCEKIAYSLEKYGIPILPLSGLRAQDLREKALKEFRDNSITVLCVTDLGSRGIDVKDVDLVINYDMPKDYASYVHRVGRAGRIRHGKCISYVSPQTDGPLLLNIKKAMEKAGQKIPPSLIDCINTIDDSNTESPSLERGNNFVNTEGVLGTTNKVEESVATINVKKEEKSAKPQVFIKQVEEEKNIETFENVTEKHPPSSEKEEDILDDDGW
uniref:ATP-dependent RNA helicase n=1 Tax=Panagrolaimus sp. ES5 TaxID=591445 RepID=A0AC34G0D4_9BILA